MNKRCLLILFVCVFGFAFEVKAQPKIDALSGVERTFGAVMTKVEEVMKKVNSAAKSFEENLLGDSFKTNYETFMALKQDISEKYAAGKEAYEKAQEAYNEAKQMYDDGKSFVEGAYDTVKGTYEQTAEKLKSLNASSPAAVEAKMTDLKEKMNDRSEVAKEELEAKLRIANENVDVLEKIYGETDDKATKEMISVLMADADLLRQQYQTDFDAMNETENKYLASDSQYQQMQNEYNEMASMLEDLKNKAKDKASGMAATFVQGMLKKSKDEKKQDYQALGDANFVRPDEPLNQAAVDRINKERRDNLLDDAASSYAHIIQQRAEMKKRMEEAERVADNMKEADYAVTAQRLAAEQEIQKLKMMHENIAAEVADLKVKTSKNMMMQDLRQQNPNKNPAEINFDNYELTEKELKEMGLGK